MVPAFVAPSVMGPPSSPAETSPAPLPSFPTRRSSDLPSKKPVAPELLPTITVYVPLVGAFTATFPAPCPVALFPRSTPVGDTSRIRGAKCADKRGYRAHAQRDVVALRGRERPGV